MSEEIEDVFELEQEADGEKPEAEEVEPEEQETDTEESGNDKPDNLPPGYMTKEEWVEKGNDPDDWRSPEIWKERGVWLERMKRTKQEHDSQIRNLNTLHRAQLQIQRQALEKSRDDAIEEGDKAAVKGYDKQLKAIDGQEQLLGPDDSKAPPSAPQIAREVNQWNAENPWINNPKDPRTVIAHTVFNQTLEDTNGDQLAALNAVKDELSKRFASPKPKGNRTEASQTRAGAKSDASLTMAQLTPDERKIWDEGFFGDDKKAFLKAVQDDRRGGKQ